MIIDFSVENYRSIKDEVVLSAVAQKQEPSPPEGDGGAIPEDDVALPRPVADQSIALLPALCIFGANASGKSNVLMALDYLLSAMAYGSPELMSIDSRPRPVVPFQLDSASAAEPTQFQVRLAIEQYIYSYSLRLAHQRVLEEALDYRPAGSHRDRLLFLRKVDPKSGQTTWKNGEDFEGSDVRLQDRIREHHTFLGFLTNSLRLSVLERLAQWLQFRWPGLGLGHENFNRRMTHVWIQRLPPEMVQQVVRVLSNFDTGIANIELGPPDPSRGPDALEVLVYHSTGSGTVRWLLEEESTGTQRLFFLMFRVLYAFESGTPMMVDELGSDLHPAITHAIVRMFQKESTNPRRAQLLFTSHDNTLQRDQVLRRDQIWFTQKRQDGSTDLYPLSDFRMRNDVALDRAYLDGRFGAVPIIPGEETVIGIAETPA